MSGAHFAVLCWPAGPELFLGRLCFGWGNPIEAGRKSAAAVLSAVEEELSRDEETQPVSLEELSLRRFSLHLPLRAEVPGKGSLSLPRGLAMVVWAVIGRRDEDTIMVELWPIGGRFATHDAEGLASLVEFHAREAAARLSPEQLSRLSLLPAPNLEIGRLKARKRSRTSRPTLHPRLSAIADRVELPKGALFASAWGREAERDRVEAASRARRPLLVVGEARVGKSTVLLEGAREPLIRAGLLWRSSADRLVAGARYLGEWQELADQLVAELEEAGASLWVEDLPRLFQVGGQGPEDSLAAYLRPALALGLHLMGELSPAALEAASTLLPGFFDRFERVIVPPMVSGAMGPVALRMAEQLQSRREIGLSREAQGMALRLLDRHQRGQRFPGKLADLLHITLADAEREGRKQIDEGHVVDAFLRKTGMPRVLIDDRLKLDPAVLRAALEAQVVGQEEAVSAIVEIITAFKIGLNDPHRPVATLLFTGPTGVGKTAMAKALAEWCFGADGRAAPLIRVDMSELQHPAQVSRLIGDGRNEPGELVRKLRERPFSVLLFDEIEKAHPVFFDALLSVLDEGTLTDAWGRVTDLRGCFIILTTNLGAPKGSAPGFGGRTGASGGIDMGALRAAFRPELLNRIDRFLRFGPLDRAVVRIIARRELSLIGERPGLRGRGLSLLFGEELVEAVVQAGFDPVLGARPLLRAVERLAVGPLGRYLLDHPTTRETTLLLELQGGEVVICGA